MTEDKRIINVEVNKRSDVKNNKNVFKMKCIFDEKGAELESVIERAFGNYCNQRMWEEKCIETW